MPQPPASHEKYDEVNVAIHGVFAPMALHAAAQEGHTNCDTDGEVQEVERLLSAGLVDLVEKPTRNSAGETPLFAACFSGRAKMVQLLLEKRADTNLTKSTDGMSPACAAVAEHHEEVLQLLLDGKADLNLASADGGTPLFVAIQAGHYDLVERLLDDRGPKSDHAKADPNGSSNSMQTPVQFLTPALLHKGESVLHKGESADDFEHAYEALDTLLSAGAEPDRVNDSSSCSALLAAAVNDCTDALELLLDARANPNQRDLEYQASGSPKDAVSPDYLFTASMEERMKLRVIVATDNLWTGVCSPKDAVSPDYLFTASMEERMKLRVIVATDNLWTGVCSFLPRRNLGHLCLWHLQSHSLRTGLALLKKKFYPHFKETMSAAVNMSPANVVPHETNVSEELAYELETSSRGGGTLGEAEGVDGRLTVFTQSLVCWNPDLLVALMPPLGPHSPGVKDGTASPLPRCNLKDHTLGPLPSERCVKQAAQEASARASKEALEPAIVFHHNHKAGGTSIKSAFQTTLCRRPKSCILFQRNTSTLLTRRVLLKKERIKRDFLFTASMEEKMKVRLIVADRFWTGVCSFLPRPCLYFTTMRSPLYHHLSYWNFLCVGGQQNHMGWNATELRLGRCERPFIDWPISPTHLKMAGNSGGKHSHRMDPQALLAETVEHAKTKLRLNLGHACTWHLQAHSLQAGLVLLKKKLDPHFRETLSMAVNMSPANAHPHPSNVSEDLAYELETSTADGGTMWANIVIWGHSIAIQRAHVSTVDHADRASTTRIDLEPVRRNLRAPVRGSPEASPLFRPLGGSCSIIYEALERRPRSISGGASPAAALSAAAEFLQGAKSPDLRLQFALLVHTDEAAMSRFVGDCSTWVLAGSFPFCGRYFLPQEGLLAQWRSDIEAFRRRCSEIWELYVYFVFLDSTAPRRQLMDVLEVSPSSLAANLSLTGAWAQPAQQMLAQGLGEALLQRRHRQALEEWHSAVQTATAKACETAAQGVKGSVNMEAIKSELHRQQAVQFWTHYFQTSAKVGWWDFADAFQECFCGNSCTSAPEIIKALVKEVMDDLPATIYKQSSLGSAQEEAEATAECLGGVSRHRQSEQSDSVWV
eukprot:g23859.t1